MRCLGGGGGAYSLFENCELRQYKYKLYGIGWFPYFYM